MTQDELAAVARAPENCSFYPACYIAGDCDFEDWRKGTCGLPADIKAQVHAEQREQSALRHARWKLAEQMKQEVMRGLHDGKLTPSPTPGISGGNHGRG